MQNSKIRAHVVWFKCTNLRLHDNEPINSAHALACKDGSTVVHILTLDSTWFGEQPRSREANLPRVGRHRAEFLLQSIQDLSNNLRRKGFPLLTFVGNSAEAFSLLSQTIHIVSVHTSGPEFCSEEQKVDTLVQQVLRVKLRYYWVFTLHHIDDLPQKFQRGKRIPGRYKPFLEALTKNKRARFVRSPLPNPSWPKPHPILESLAEIFPFPSLEDLVPKIVLEEDEYNPSLAKGGELEALKAMQKYIWKEERIKNYVGSSDSCSPGKYNALNSTTRLAPYLATGCLSARMLYNQVQKFERKKIRNRSTYWVYHEMIFRDFFAFNCIKWGDKMFFINGPLDSSGHPWRQCSPKVVKDFERWTQGKTGYPFVDAGMRQLKKEGHCPHLLRQICAAFLVRDLRIDWRWGAEWFERNLIDYTPDANWGNWGYRILPIQQLLPLETAHITSLEILNWPFVHDPHLEYILRWLPELEAALEYGRDCVREPWRLAQNYKRVKRIHIMPRRDSPLWIMSVNRNNWPDYNKMLSGNAWTLSFSSEADDNIVTGVDYPPPIIPPIELEVFKNKIPVNHSWGVQKKKANSSKRPKKRRYVKRNRRENPL